MENGANALITLFNQDSMMMEYQYYTLDHVSFKSKAQHVLERNGLQDRADLEMQLFFNPIIMNFTMNGTNSTFDFGFNDFMTNGTNGTNESVMPSSIFNSAVISILFSIDTNNTDGTDIL